MTSNPLRQPRPDRACCLYVATFGAADEHAVYASYFARYHVHLTGEVLWLSKELCLPLAQIRACRIVKAGLLIRRYALEIAYTNPITNGAEAVYLCQIDFLGFYHTWRLEQLREKLEGLVR